MVGQIRVSHSTLTFRRIELLRRLVRLCTHTRQRRQRDRLDRVRGRPALEALAMAQTRTRYRAATKEHRSGIAERTSPAEDENQAHEGPSTSARGRDRLSSISYELSLVFSATAVENSERQAATNRVGLPAFI